jgi:hypothetical protein
MRLEYGTLNHLTERQFADQVAIAAEDITVGGKQAAERLAVTLGL